MFPSLSLFFSMDVHAEIIRRVHASLPAWRSDALEIAKITGAYAVCVVCISNFCGMRHTVYRIVLMAADVQVPLSSRDTTQAGSPTLCIP